MKKIIALLLALSMLFAVCTVALAESSVEHYTQLLTDYTWKQVSYSFLYLTNNQMVFPNFRYLATINLSDPLLWVTGDGSGKVYIVNLNTTANTEEYRNDRVYGRGYGSACPGEISFSADETEMLIAVVSGDLYGVFLYRRQ